jgi:RNA polymerase sigma-70 factor (ECF subfamily)
VDRSSNEDEGASFWDRLPDDAPDAQALLGRDTLWADVESAIDTLPPEQREVVLMRHQSELTFREIAELTGVSINTALGRMRYALINLRKTLEPEYFDETTADIPGAPRRASERIG